MVNHYFLIGSGGLLGKKIFEYFKKKENITKISAREYVGLKTDFDRKKFIIKKITNSISKYKSAKVALIFAHRIRDNNIVNAINSEILITRNITKIFSETCLETRVVVLGSVTGRLIDKKTLESYHYTKDIQKIIVRQSIKHKKLFIRIRTRQFDNCRTFLNILRFFENGSLEVVEQSVRRARISMGRRRERSVHF
jgi:transcriptional regulator of met regulon